jgi:hypothetical protein
MFVLLGLLACGLSFASVRMAGLGWGLTGMVDDPVTDMMIYPQLNVLTPEWLVGIEMKQPGSYNPYFHSHGRWSFAADLDVYAAEKDGSCDPSLAVATQVGPLSLGASARFAFIDEPVSPPKDIRWGGISFNHDIGVAVVGVRWSRPAMTLDFAISGGEYDHYMWSTDGGSDTLLDRYFETSLTPLLRATWLRDRLSWRAFMSYTCDATDWPGHRASRQHTLSLSGGPTFAAGNLLAVSGLRATVKPQAHYCWWDLRLPVGIEWNPGPFVLRLGADAQYSSNLGFGSRTYVGLGLRPTEHMRLDFAPDMDNAANLRGWELAAALEL